MSMAETDDNRARLQRESDRLHMELKELYLQIRQKDAAIDKVDRVLYPEDYEVDAEHNQ